MDADYSRFCQDVLLACAEAQTGGAVRPVDIDELCGEKFSGAPPTWVQTVTATLVEHGFGDDWSTHDGHAFYIRGSGLLEVEAIRKSRQPKSVVNRIMAIPRSDWIAIGALIVSLVALLK